MAKFENGFLFFYDWIEPFKNLDGEDFKKLFISMVEYQKNGTKPEEFEGKCAIIAAFVFPQLDRRISKSESGKKGMEKRWGSKK